MIGAHQAIEGSHLSSRSRESSPLASTKNLSCGKHGVGLEVDDTGEKRDEKLQSEERIELFGSM